MKSDVKLVPERLSKNEGGKLTIIRVRLHLKKATPSIRAVSKLKMLIIC